MGNLGSGLVILELHSGGKKTLNLAPNNVGISGNGFGILNPTHMGAYNLGQRIWDLESQETCMEAYSSEAYNLGQRTWDLELYSFA